MPVHSSQRTFVRYRAADELLGEFVDVLQNPNKNGASVTIAIATKEKIGERRSGHYPARI